MLSLVAPTQHCSRRLISVSRFAIASAILVTIATHAAAQNPPQSSVSTCRKNEAIDTIREQISVSKTLDDPIQRITLLIRAADLLWPLDNERARAAFTEAFDVATDHEQANLAKPLKTLLMFNADQRYVVIRAVAKRQPDWAKALTKKALQQDKQVSEQIELRDPRRAVITGQRLLESAIKLLPVDMNAAMQLAVSSLNYPANSELTRFLYELAKVNQVSADSLYAQALLSYREKPMREFLYLQAYPFAFEYGGDMPVFGFYQIPAGFKPNPSLQREFVQTLIVRAQQAMEVPLDDGDTYNWLPGTAHILQVFTRVEPHVRSNNPNLVDQMTQVQQRIKVSLPIETQKTLAKDRESETPSKGTFEDGIEAAEKLSDVDDREELFTQTILNTTEEPVEGVVAAIDKVADSNIRAILYDWLYFTRGLAAAKSKQLKDASKFAAKVGDIESRAYLYLEIGKAALALPVSDVNGLDMLELAIADAQKSPKTIFTARTLLNAAEAYRKTDLSRSLEVLRNAIEATNALQHPDFGADDQTLIKRTQGKGWRREARFYMPGLDPQAVFTSFAKTDFEGTQSQTQIFADKLLRALTTLSVADVCLQHQPPARRQKTPIKP
ncbi:MAG TPA: hypothetical protein VLA93_08420 [Pyrinomonadaceae bacterium]|nr:hypothetical protein [Pyrinomonadaceae bacterium]